ncbi:MAG: hypothetical protein HYV09_05640 [Deltaproteobacteria bacterium]|nr:hypothetical protein [Deltaproteobacteria bacterium]
MANARLSLLLGLALATAPRSSRADDDEPIVTNVVNGLVYVSVGTRDGAAVGDQVAVLGEGGAPIGTIEFDLCGEVICRAKLPSALAGKIVRGMRVMVRAEKAPAAVAPAGKPTAEPAPKAGEPPPKAAGEPGPAPTSEPTPEAPPIPKKKKKSKEVAPPVAASPVPPPQVNPPTLGDVLGGAPTSAIPEERPFHGGPVPPGYRVVRRSNDGLVRWGWIGLGVSYGLGAIVGLGANNGGGWMALPVLGPWAYLAMRETEAPNGYSSSSSDDGTAGVVMIGLGQGISALLLIIGYAGSKTLVRTGSAVAMTVTPVVTRNTYGLGVTATF